MQKTVLSAPCQSCLTRLDSIFCDRNLSSEEIKQLHTSKGPIQFKKGQLIYSEGCMANGIYCIGKGKVKLFKMGEEGKEQTIRLAKEGDIMGHSALLSDGRYSNSASALEETSICYIPGAVFLRTLKKNNQLCLELAKLLARDLIKAEKKITQLAQKPVRERVAEALINLKETYGYELDEQTIGISVSRQEIANIVGTAKETAIRLLSEFKQDKMLEFNGKKIRILNYKGLLNTSKGLVNNNH